MRAIGWWTVLLTACGGAPSAAPDAKPASEAPQAAPAAAPEAKPEAAAGPAGQDLGDGWQLYGAAFPATAPAAVALPAVLEAPATFLGRDLVVEGKVSDVCQKKGCWMVMADGDRTLRVTMKDHAFGVTFGATGQTAQISGQLVEKAVDAKTVEHYRAESGEKARLPEDAAAGGKTYELVATAVKLRK
jgi:hypothetical protein